MEKETIERKYIVRDKHGQFLGDYGYKYTSILGARTMSLEEARECVDGDESIYPLEEICFKLGEEEY